MKFNLARRAAMKALIGSPIAARGIVEAAAKEALGSGSAMAVEPSGIHCDSNQQDPIWELFEKHGRRQRHADETRRAKNLEFAMSESVRSKKSWSPAFKHHITAREVRAMQRWDDYSDEGRIRALVSIGVLPKSLLDGE